MQMKNSEPSVEEIEDYDGNESREKKFVIWGVVIVGLLLGGLYSYLRSHSSVEDALIKAPYIMDIEKK